MNPQAIKIYEILKDGNFHCPREWGYADGHCKRITDINEYLLPKGQKVDSEVCRCGHHISRLKKRRIVVLEHKIASYTPPTAPQSRQAAVDIVKNPIAREFLERWLKPKECESLKIKQQTLI